MGLAYSITPHAAPAPLASRTQVLLEAPIAPTLLRLAVPNVVVILLVAATSTFDAFFVGWLGAEALTGVSLVFPMLMLLQTMSAGGMGGGVASAVARALGAGQREDANALVVHALAIHWLGGGLQGLFAAMALALGVYGTTVALAVKAGVWR